MAKFVFKDQLINALDRKDGWPSYQTLRAFRKEQRGGRGFQNQRYKQIRSGQALEDRNLLVDLLLCINDRDPEFIQRTLRVDCQQLSESELSKLFIKIVEDDYLRANKADADLISKGPQASAVELIKLKSSSITSLQLKKSDIHKASKLWAKSVSYDVLKHHTTEADAEDTAVEEFSFVSISQFEKFLLQLIDANPNSVLFRRRDDGSGFLLVAFPLDNLTYERLLQGEVDECEIASQGIVSKSKNLGLWGVFEYYRDLSPKQRYSLHTQMMNCSLWQIASLTDDLLTNGMRIISYSPTPGPNPAAKKIEKWLRNWRFKNLRRSMKRTNFPLWQLELRQSPIHHPMAIVIWCLILLYQTLLRHSDNKAISEWMDDE